MSEQRYWRCPRCGRVWQSPFCGATYKPGDCCEVCLEEDGAPGAECVLEPVAVLAQAEAARLRALEAAVRDGVLFDTVAEEHGGFTGRPIRGIRAYRAALLARMEATDA